MDIKGRRPNYTLLSQNTDEPPLFNPPKLDSNSGEKDILKPGRVSAFDWEVFDQRMIQPQLQQNRIGTAGLQRQSSGSSFGESSISGDNYVPSLSNPEMAFAPLNDACAELPAKAAELSGSGDGDSSSKSWAQQTEESYQLQLALALRLSSEATCADDPNCLDPFPDDSASSYLPTSVEAISHRFWVTGCLSYFDKIPDGFHAIDGMDPYVWAVCSDIQESSRIPSLESLKTVDPAIVSSVEVISVDRRSDPSLKELQNRIHSMSSSCITTKEVVDHLAKLVCNRMGISVSNKEDDLIPLWKECTDELKDCLGSIVLPIGSLSIGLCRHRSLLFKILADTIGLSCRIAKGCKYCTREDASSCLVRFGLEREYLIDLVEKPGCLYEPNSLLNGPSTISFFSPLNFPRLRQLDSGIDFKLLAKQYFSDFQSLDLMLDDSLAAGTVLDGDIGNCIHPKQSERSYEDRTSYLPSSCKVEEISHTPPFPTNSWIKVRSKEQRHFEPSNAYDVSSFTNIVEDSVPLKVVPPIEHKDVEPHVALLNPRVNKNKDIRSGDVRQLTWSIPSDVSFDVEDICISWSDLALKERIGAGSFGTVHLADWNGCDVAVKILMEQDLHGERFKEFLQEVAIMKRLRHPNIVLFMGAVTEPPNLSIVTEYLSRGSLYRLLHKTGARDSLDERRRMGMAFDVAKGMNYLHKRNPPIVHRDLKSPNLLVDRKYTVKVCDFGLSRLKANTFLSSKSAAGTPEWMAPEVLRDEPSNEKSDVYSFGVILWELATLQQPWGNLNPAQLLVLKEKGLKYRWA
ncbi:serine/threonine-protein kinase CTR1-like isoform X2 [Henckelia pumila]|uniref:serine/threonine-protein kinase CTR1-like isoform X2 n=1 Tax=Henckelia pumila TaxID=405737 RepID=UPI003C6E9BE2